MRKYLILLRYRYAFSITLIFNILCIHRYLGNKLKMWKLTLEFNRPIKLGFYIGLVASQLLFSSQQLIQNKLCLPKALSKEFAIQRLLSLPQQQQGKERYIHTYSVHIISHWSLNNLFVTVFDIDLCCNNCIYIHTDYYCVVILLSDGDVHMRKMLKKLTTS